MGSAGDKSAALYSCVYTHAHTYIHTCKTAAGGLLFLFHTRVRGANERKRKREIEVERGAGRPRVRRIIARSRGCVRFHARPRHYRGEREEGAEEEEEEEVIDKERPKREKRSGVRRPRSATPTRKFASYLPALFRCGYSARNSISLFEFQLRSEQFRREESRRRSNDFGSHDASISRPRAEGISEAN